MKELRKHVKQMVIDYAIAVLCAIVMICALGWGFKLEPRKTDLHKKRELIVMLSANKQECRKAHRVLIDYMEIDDPAEIPMPHDYGPNGEYTARTGYDRNSEYVPREERYSPLKPRLETMPPLALDPRSVETSIEVVAHLARREQLRAAPVLPPPPPLPEVGPGIRWVDLSGRPIEPSFPAQEVGSLDGAKLIAAGPTELTAIPPQEMSASLPLLPRIQVRKSCGNPDLDTAAVRHLSRYLASLGVRRKGEEWKRWYKARRNVRIVWRHVPGMVRPDNQTKPPKQPIPVGEKAKSLKPLTRGEEKKPSKPLAPTKK